ncbi:MAG: DUF4230 domain-containing protein [Burkholderiaceae bacterium]
MSKFLSTLGAIALGAGAMWLIGTKGEKLPPPSQPSLIDLEKMGHLVSVKVNYANVIEFSEQKTQDIPWTQWELHFGGTRVLLVARGDCLVGTDIRLAKYVNTNEETRTVTLALPSPQPISARVSHESREKGGSYFYKLDDSGIAPLIDSASRTKAIDGALKMAQADVDKACRSTDVLSTAKKNTEAVLIPAFSAIGWKVQFKWL